MKWSEKICKNLSKKCISAYRSKVKSLQSYLSGTNIVITPINAHGKFWKIDLNDHLYTLYEGPLRIAITTIIPFGKPTFEAPHLRFILVLLARDPKKWREYHKP